jgi:hypothetical protein
VGKHAAPEGASSDPIVADALAHRPAQAAHHAAVEGPVGWPGAPAREGGGLGWPADASTGDGAAPDGAAPDGAAADRSEGDGAPEGERAPEEPAPPVARRSWLRLLGAGRVA